MIIKIDDDIKLNFTSETIEDEVRQNIQMILSVNKNEQPLDRDFGVNIDFLDTPTSIAKARTIAETIEKVEKYEPRAKVLVVDFEEFDIAKGKITPRLEVEIDV